MFRKFFLTILSVLAVTGFSAAGVKAEPVKYEFDTAHTQIMFAVNHLGFSNSHGRFLEFDGDFMLDETAPENSAVNVTIKTASVFMGDEKWDDHLKNEDFFNVEKFPDMIFKSTGIEVTGENTANITGDLTILGVTKPVVLEAVMNKIGKHPFGDKYAAGFSATTSIKRSEFGMKYGLPMVGDDVKIMIEVEAIREDATAAGTGNK